MGVSRFEELRAWQEARILTKAIYAETRRGELSKDFALARQLQRASVSIMANIAEGFERGRRREFHQALSMAKASCGEVRSLLYVALDAGYLTSQASDALHSQATRVAYITNALRRAVAKPLTHTPQDPPGIR